MIAFKICIRHMRRLVTSAGWLVIAASLDSPAWAQITPDSTLGTESSVVTPDVTVRGALADLIEGGAIREANLFHSFDQFNVGEGQRVYFANPVGIENIIGRVTGGEISQILGLLGVDGGANLSLINPQGFVFGENAQLDVTGSFLATTDSLQFEDGFEYRATNPEPDSPLTISVPLGLQRGATGGEISNRGNLAAGQDFSLIAGDLDLEGEVTAGGNLLLQGNRVKIRDSVDAPFIAAAKGNLLVQGNESVDIFALNHGDSGLFSGGDMVLRSANAVGGDAHYWSGGSFRIEELDGSLGDLFSPNDPIIRSLGDAEINDYFGTSLHILAGGSISLGTVIITDSDATGDTINPTDTPALANVTLSDGISLVINGTEIPTLDVRAGVDPAAIGSPIGLTGNNFFFIDPDPSNITTNIPSDADINVGDVFVDAPNGLVFITNQYKANDSLPVVAIEVGGIFTDDFFFSGDGGNVVIDSRNDLVINDGVDASSTSGDGGDVKLLADEDITFNPSASIFASGLRGGGINLNSQGNVSLVAGLIISDSFTTDPNKKGNNLTIRTSSLSLKDGAFIRSGTLGKGSAGDIDITASESVSLEGEDNNGLPSEITSQVLQGGEGKGGNITLSTSSLSLNDGAAISANTLGKGSTGDIDITASESISLEGEDGNGESSFITNQVLTGGEGEGGNVTLSTSSLSLKDGAGISTDTLGKGSGGDINITASESVSLEGEASNGIFSTITSQVAPGAEGKGGNITLSTSSLSLTDGAAISTSTFGKGSGGYINITASESVSLEGEDSFGLPSSIGSQVGPGAEGKGGNITLSTSSLLLTDGAFLSASTFGKGSGGYINITASELVSLEGENSNGGYSFITSQVLPEGEGEGGNITLSTSSLSLKDGAGISTDTLGKGSGGDINITASESVFLEGENSNGEASFITSEVASGAEGDGGDISLSTSSLSLTDGVRISTSTFGKGSGGDINIAASESISLKGGDSNGQFSFIASQVLPGGEGEGGNITLSTSSLSLTDGVRISASTLGKGSGGDINIAASESVSLQGEDSNGLSSGIGSQVSPGAEGRGGDITLSTSSLSLTGGTAISASTFGKGRGGDINITASQSVSLDGEDSDGLLSLITSQVNRGAEGDGGDISLSTSSLSLTDGTFVSSTTRGKGRAGDIDITASDINLSASRIIARTESDSRGGDTRINANNLTLNNNALISSASEGLGRAGDIDINLGMHLNASDSDIFTTSEQSAGGRINITAWNIFLRGDSDISTFVLSGEGGGGDIIINAGSVLAFDDSDILSFAQDGKGGDITLNTPAFFGQGFVLAPSGTNPITLQGNGRVDVNASGAINGTIIQPDVTPVTNNLSELPENPIDTDALLANSCIVRTEGPQGNFTITGSGNLPTAPGNITTSSYPTGEVQALPEEETNTPWQEGGPVIEATGIYQLANGRLVMGRECS